mmetsp:Transcript_6437/g.16774  ORF Transcript_6437/g.16774 Transcript_6437/m.16774 type:complete len:163 (-) Transcript_6437:173-661(-)
MGVLVAAGAFATAGSFAKAPTFGPKALLMASRPPLFTGSHKKKTVRTELMSIVEPPTPASSIPPWFGPSTIGSSATLVGTTIFGGPYRIMSSAFIARMKEGMKEVTDKLATQAGLQTLASDVQKLASEVHLDYLVIVVLVLVLGIASLWLGITILLKVNILE